MSHGRDSQLEHHTLDEIYDELAEQFVTAARAESSRAAAVSRPRRRRWVLALVGLSVIGAPVALAVSSDDSEPVPVASPGSPGAVPLDAERPGADEASSDDEATGLRGGTRPAP